MSESSRGDARAPSEDASSGGPGFAVAVLALLAAFLLSAFRFVRAGHLNQDEGWYLHAARLVYEGALPYRDFAFFQAPLLPYVYGLPQVVFGGGIETGRLTSLVLGLVTMALGARLSFERAGRPAVFFFLVIAPVTPLLLWSFATTRTEPLNALLLTLSAFLLLRRDAGPLDSAGALVAAILAVATRIASLPFAGVVLVWVVSRHRTSRRDLTRALLPAALVTLVFSGFLIAAGPEAVYFDLITRQTERQSQLRPEEAWTWGQIAMRRLADASLLRAYYGGIPLLSFACAFGVGAAWLAKREQGSFTMHASGLALLGFAAYLPNLVPQVVFPEYFAAAFPIFLVLTSWCVGHAYASCAREGRHAIVAASAVLVAFHLASLLGQQNLHITKEGEGTDLEALRKLSAQLVRNLEPGGRLATLDTYFAVESGYVVPEGWEMGVFAYFPQRSEKDGARFHLLTPGRLRASLRDPSIAGVLLSDHALGIFVERRNTGLQPKVRLTQAQLHAALPALARFRLVRVFEDFGRFQEKLYFMLPVEPR